MSRPVEALLAGRVIFVSGARSQTVRERLLARYPSLSELHTRQGFRHGFGGTFAWLPR